MTGGGSAPSARNAVLQGRTITPGAADGEALVSRMGISFFGGVDPETGTVVERGHDLEGLSGAGKVLVFPSGKGSTVGSYTLFRMRKAGTAPAAILNAECEPITAVGCILAGIPCVDRLPIERIASGAILRVDGTAGRVEIIRANGSVAVDAP
jgi:predicted aconitase with swiveling domain